MKIKKYVDLHTKKTGFIIYLYMIISHRRQVWRVVGIYIRVPTIPTIPLVRERCKLYYNISMNNRNIGYLSAVSFEDLNCIILSYVCAHYDGHMQCPQRTE